MKNKSPNSLKNQILSILAWYAKVLTVKKEIVRKHLWFILILCVKCFATMYVSVLQSCFVPIMVITGHQMPWNWSCTWLCMAILELGIELRSSARTTIDHIHWSISPSPLQLFWFLVFVCLFAYFSD